MLTPEATPSVPLIAQNDDSPMTVSEKLWEFADSLSVAYAAMQVSNDAEFARLQQVPERGLGFAERRQKEAAEERYWNIHQAVVDLKLLENTVIDNLSLLEEGQITEEAAAAILPTLVTDESNEDVTAVSKRRAAIQREEERQRRINGKDSNAFIEPWFERSSLADSLYGPEIAVTGPVGATDPRRITTGRNKTRLNPTQALDPLDAEGRFIEATSDTHGGKSRKNGKNSSRFVSSASGKKIRKR